MTNASWLEAMAAERLENPYWTAFKLALPEGDNSDFLIWISQRWRALGSAQGYADGFQYRAAVGMDRSYRAMLAHLEDIVPALTKAGVLS